MNDHLRRILFGYTNIDWSSFYNPFKVNDTNKSTKNVSPKRHKARRDKARASRKARKAR